MPNKTSEQKPDLTERDQCDQMAAEGPKPTRPHKTPREGDPDYVPPE